MAKLKKRNIVITATIVIDECEHSKRLSVEAIEKEIVEALMKNIKLPDGQFVLGTSAFRCKD